MSKKRNTRLIIFVLSVAAILTAGCFFGINKIKNTLPDVIYIHTGEEAEVTSVLRNPLITYPDSIGVSKNGSYKLPCSFLGVVPLKNVQIKRAEHKTVKVCGVPVGLYMETQGVLIVDTGEIVGQDGISRNPAENIAKAGDYILKVNGNSIHRKKQLIKEIQKSNGEAVKLLVNRKGEEIPLSLYPIQTEESQYKLGIWVRDNTQGIGTMTYMEEDGKFGALGHGISDTDTGELLTVSGGELYQAKILSIMKGTRGTPGELSGYIEYQDENKLGEIQCNTEKGIFGQIENFENISNLQAEIGYKQEVKKGNAEIVTDLGDGVEAYEIEITEIHKGQENTNKAFEIVVKDARLLGKTGGIVQGMSGSPIMQNGKLVGAVTHVFVRNPEKGYGIFIENMLW